MERNKHQLDNIDYNPVQVKKLLELYQNIKSLAYEGNNLDFVCIVTDIEDAIANVDLTEQQRRFLNMRLVGMSNSEIHRELGICKQRASQLLNIVSKKISRYLTDRY